MSAVKSFGFGVSLIVIAVQTAPGGTMPPAAIRLAMASNQDPAAENLAMSSNYGFPGGFQSYQAPNSQGGGSALSLGVNGGNLAPASIAPQVGPTPSYSAPAPSQSYPAPAAPSPAPPDAFINFGNGPYAEAGNLTTGIPQAFSSSPVFTHLFGPNGPTSTDVANFEAEVLATIKGTYDKAGLAINLTTDPNAQAPHTMSVVSGATYSATPGAIGITDVGNSGFSFIDKFGGVQDADQLAIAIGHNLSHELMHAFGIANHPEQTGPYVDAAASTLQALSDPNTGFSPVAASLLATLNFQAVGQSVTAGAQRIDGDQLLIPAPSTVPEPSTVALWALAGGLAVASRRRMAA